MPLIPKQQPPYYESSSAPETAKTYIALISQTSTNAPTATIIYNTLSGPIVWTRDGVGDYTGTLADAFTIGKTITPPMSDSMIIPASYDSVGYISMGVQGDTDVIKLFTFADVNFTPKELSAIGGNILITIIVYP